MSRSVGSVSLRVQALALGPMPHGRWGFHWKLMMHGYLVGMIAAAEPASAHGSRIC